MGQFHIDCVQVCLCFLNWSTKTNDMRFCIKAVSYLDRPLNAAGKIDPSSVCSTTENVPTLHPCFLFQEEASGVYTVKSA